jgi:glycogen synthase
MKMLMTADPIGGVWRYALELCDALRHYGVHVTLATLGGQPTQAQRAEVGRFPNVELRTSDFRLEWMASPWESLEAAGEWLLSLEREIQPQIVHLNHLVHADLPWRAPVLVVGHSCVLSWFTAVHGGVPDGWQRYRENVTRSLHAARLVVAPTEAMMRCLHRHYGVLVRHQVIPNGLDPRHFRALHKENIVLSAGRLWDAGKNVEALCGIAESVPWPIYVAGSTTSPDGASRPVTGVRFLGQLSPQALSAWYSAAPVYALPARYEPFGLTALEAALSGCALVLGDIESLREVWGCAARYVPPDDHGALRDALNELVTDANARHTLASLARTRAARYSAQQLAANYWNTYWSMLEAKETSACISYSSITH